MVATLEEGAATLTVTTSFQAILDAKLIDLNNPELREFHTCRLRRGRQGSRPRPLMREDNSRRQIDRIDSIVSLSHRELTAGVKNMRPLPSWVSPLTEARASESETSMAGVQRA